MSKECPNCKAVNRKRYLSYKNMRIDPKKKGKTGYYVCTYCGFKVRA